MNYYIQYRDAATGLWERETCFEGDRNKLVFDNPLEALEARDKLNAELIDDNPALRTTLAGFRAVNEDGEVLEYRESRVYTPD